jgi:hypothetical protein
MTYREFYTQRHTLCESNLTSAELDLWLAYNSSTEVAVATNPRSNMLLIAWFEAALLEPAKSTFDLQKVDIAVWHDNEH